MNHATRAVCTAVLSLLFVVTAACRLEGAKHVFGVQCDQLLLNGQHFKMIVLRFSNALITGHGKPALLDALPLMR